MGILALYLLTVIPTAVDQDSGELVAAAHVLGIPHPTGYPLWTLLAKVFDLLPFGHTSAYRIALLSAVSASAAAGIICWIVTRLTGVALPGIFAGTSFGLWLPTWSQAVLAEVYALESLLFVLCLLALYRWEHDNRSGARLQWIALTCGFAAMHHRTAFLATAPALGAAFVLTRPRRIKALVSGVLLFAAPFLFYLYLPIRAAARPPLNWGNPDTLDRFLHHVLGRQYSRWAFANPLDVVVEQGRVLLGESLAGEGWMSLVLVALSAPLIIWGFSWWCRRRPAVAVSLAAGGLALCVWVLEWGDTSDSKVWLTPVGALLALLGGFGLAKARAVAPRRLAPYLSAAAGAAICLILLSANWARADRSGEWVHRDRWLSALSQMDDGAIFVAEWDAPMFVTYYLQNVEAVRADVTHMRPHGLWSAWYVESIEDAELREISEALWRQITSDFDLHHPGTPEFWQGTALFAHRLAEHYRGRRTVYALHGPGTELIPGPPYFVGLRDDLWRLDFRMPDLTRGGSAGEPIARFPEGFDLISLEFDTDEPEAGDLVGFRARWRLRSRLSGAILGIRLVPAHSGESQDVDPDGGGWEGLSEKGLFLQGFPVLHCLYGLAPSPPGTVYEQQGRLMIPSNAQAGEYRLALGFAQSYPPQYDHWVELSEDHSILVRSRPLPTN